MLSQEATKYLHDIRSNWKLRLYFLKNLPSAIWWSFGVKSATTERTEVTLPYNWRTQNPFKSIYFAALAGAGELSTGVMATMARMSGGDVSMLVLEQRAEFLKKYDKDGNGELSDEERLREVKKALFDAIDTKQVESSSGR